MDKQFLLCMCINVPHLLISRGSWPVLFHVCLQSKQIDIVYPVQEGADGFLPAIKRICREAAEAARSEYKLIILSDRKAGPGLVPVG